MGKDDQIIQVRLAAPLITSTFPSVKGEKDWGLQRMEGRSDVWFPSGGDQLASLALNRSSLTLVGKASTAQSGSTLPQTGWVACLRVRE
jgi:hypothetical protein